MNGKNRKWAVFTALCLAYMPSSYAQYQLSVFGPELMERYGLTTSQFSAILTSPMIVAIFLQPSVIRILWVIIPVANVEPGILRPLAN